MIATAERPGSLDAAIRAPEHADLAALVAGLPELRAIGFNGPTAAKAGRLPARRGADGPELLDLPSSSPAYAGMPFAEKLARWSALTRHPGGLIAGRGEI